MSTIKELVRLKARALKARGKPLKFKRARRPKFPAALVVAYQRALKAFVKEANDRAWLLIEGRVPALLEQAARERKHDASTAHADAWGGNVTSLMALVGAQYAGAITGGGLKRVIEKQSKAIADFGRRDMTAILTASLGVDVFFREPWLAASMEAFTEQNVSLIKGLTGDAQKKIENEVFNAAHRGERWEELAPRLRATIDGSMGRAAFVARDQTAKFNSSLNRLRQKEAGIEEYDWSTSRDERVREMHADLEGQRFNWNEPPVTNPNGDTNHPGEDYNCRCVAIPVLEGMLGDD